MSAVKLLKSSSSNEPVYEYLKIYKIDLILTIFEPFSFLLPET